MSGTATEARAIPAPHVLTNGRYRVHVSVAGAGGSLLGPWALTRWTADRLVDGEGWFLYVRDLESERLWSAGHQPVQQAPDLYEVRFGDGLVTIGREDEGIETRTEIRIDPAWDLEWRRHTFTNRSDRPRRLEITSYAEVALNDPGADAAHPAFSKLFLETELLPGLEALLARRRPRSPDDPALHLAHALIPERASEYECETDRARFIGRGRTLADPLALGTGVRLSGTTGSVLDPVLSIRRRLILQAGSTARLDAVLAAGTDRARVEQAIVYAAGENAGDELFAKETIEGGAVWRLPSRPQGRYQRAAGESRSADQSEPLLFFNGYGGFAEPGDEYVIRIDRTAEGARLPPLPWTNVVANPHTGFVATERGPSFTWHGNSRENRLTPWLNDPVSDPSGEALYVRDEDRRIYWSPVPGPAPGDGPYEVRHGFGYTTWRHDSGELLQETHCFVSRDEPVRVLRLRITSGRNEEARLSAFFYCEWVLGAARAQTPRAVRAETVLDGSAILAWNERNPEFGVAFAASAGPPGARCHATRDRGTFLGRWGRPDRPDALEQRETLEDRSGGGADACAALQVTADIAAGATAEWVFLLGQAPSREAALELIARYRGEAQVSLALAEARELWADLLSGVRIETPSPALDVLMNGWLSYQNLACRVWARSAFYQSGGAFGFRDQLQDAAALLYLSPEIPRRQILLHAAHQFVEGDVLHWWHPPWSRGIRTRFSDDLLWLPWATLFHVESTGDERLLDEQVRFLHGPPLAPGEDEASQTPRDSGESADLFEHCCRALDRSLTRGRHGLPLMGSGDWNDGMNRVGHGGEGESVWLGFFLHDILARFIPLCDRRGAGDRAGRYRAYAASLAVALDEAGWDGRWYRRAYYDDGTPLGSAESDEARIDAIAQAWAVLSGAAPPDRAGAALDALEGHLVDEAAGLIRLLTPPFDRTAHDAGYIKGYLPGVRENGGQYTHGALWAIRALAEAGRTERAAHLLEMITPIRHTDSPEAVEIYRGEPYVVAADVYAAASHVGRAGWTWYTGSAGWMYRVGLESVLGLTLRGGRELAIRPCIPHAWPGFTVRYRLPDRRTVYEISVRRGAEPTRVVAGETPARVEEESVIIGLSGDGATHRVEILLGPDVGPRYRQRGPPAP